MKSICYLVTLATLVFCSNLSAEIVDFEDVIPGEIPTTPFETGGLQFVSTSNFNAVFEPDQLPGANNGTQAFAWCGSNCDDGQTQIVTVTAAESEYFDLTSIDAGNLIPGGFDIPGEWVPGMQVRLDGYLANGSVVTEFLSIEEDVFGTYALSGFDRLSKLEISAPPVLKDGPTGNPDALIDNLVWNPSAIPEPGSAALISFTLVGCVLRRRR